MRQRAGWQRVGFASCFFLLALFFACGEGAPDEAGGQAPVFETGLSDAAAPLNTTITSQPADPSNSTTATFKFKCNKPACTFKCQLDSKAWSACASPKSYKNQVGGDHIFNVKATDTATGKSDRTPATYSWSIQDVWLAISTDKAPTAREEQSAVWTGSEMIVWGGLANSTVLNTGKRYNPSTNSWTPTSTTNAPSERHLHTAVWTTGLVTPVMIVWGGMAGTGGWLNSGGKYDPATNAWTATNTANSPGVRYDHSAVWTGTEMIIWAGYGGFVTSSGGRYDPVADTWTGTNTTGAPAGRELHTAVWTGTEMIVWGGYDESNSLNTGGRYNPAGNSWTPTPTTNAPDARSRHAAVWATGLATPVMIVWGGYNGSVSPNYLFTGGKYDPIGNSWVATSTTNAPDGRHMATAVWTGSEMIVWGGNQQNIPLSSGGKYDPTLDSWTAASLLKAPTARYKQTAVWTGQMMIIWGGYGGIKDLQTGGRYWP